MWHFFSPKIFYGEGALAALENINGKKCFIVTDNVMEELGYVNILTDALKKCGLKDGMCLSFHHQLRNGDNVVNLTLEAVRNLGVKDIMMAQTAVFNVHEPVIEFIKEGVKIVGGC